MNSWVLSRTDLLFLPEISLFIFLTVFVGSIVWMYRPGAQQVYRYCRSMALEPDEVEATDDREH